MIPTKVYILKIDTDISNEYAKTAADSCKRVNLDWEFVNGYTVDSIKKEINQFPIKSKAGLSFNGKGGACTAGHLHIWKMIADRNECAIVLEHDAIMLHKPTIDIPDDMIVALGYKVKDPEKYDAKKAGPPIKIEDRSKHGGAHAYALTSNTAKTLVRDIEQKGSRGMVDNTYFLRNTRPTGVKLGIMSPICALGWLRESTIWPKSAVDNYRPLVESFQKYYNSKQDLGLKN